jgi:hypothetical protein
MSFCSYRCTSDLQLGRHNIRHSRFFVSFNLRCVIGTSTGALHCSILSVGYSFASTQAHLCHRPSLIQCNMMTQYSTKLMLLAVTALFTAEAFAPSTPCSTTTCQQSSLTALTMAVVDIDGESAFDKTVQNAGNSLVVIDYSTTW